MHSSRQKESQGCYEIQPHMHRQDDISSKMEEFINSFVDRDTSQGDCVTILKDPTPLKIDDSRGYEELEERATFGSTLLNFLDHQEYAHGMSHVITQNILADKCILDGEMLVWDASINRFAEFGSNQEIAKAAREGLDSDRQLCCILVLSTLCSSLAAHQEMSVLIVIHQSLKERQEILRKVVKPIKGRLEILVPDGGLNAHRLSGKDAAVAL
ncbi:putative DNA ligase 4 [Capsicum baccatum]|uniref:DNA ligase 4 n=1 Tax=Capsicum baccatum TaxID=33114 RepID=A0A2G2W4B8_CAPBA|nr:putative DNA ligase 4 [Capsicum baccatum]